MDQHFRRAGGLQGGADGDHSADEDDHRPVDALVDVTGRHNVEDHHRGDGDAEGRRNAYPADAGADDRGGEQPDGEKRGARLTDLQASFRQRHTPEGGDDLGQPLRVSLEKQGVAGAEAKRLHAVAELLTMTGDGDQVDPEALAQAQTPDLSSFDGGPGTDHRFHDRRILRAQQLGRLAGASGHPQAEGREDGIEPFRCRLDDHDIAGSNGLPAVGAVDAALAADQPQDDRVVLGGEIVEVGERLSDRRASARNPRLAHVVLDLEKFA